MDRSIGQITIPEIVLNIDGRYEGDLKHYFKVVFENAQNLYNPYHNLRHSLHVMLLCHDACAYYKHTLSPRDCRDLLIAALFHDFDHSGMVRGKDGEEIEKAVAGLKRYIAPEDQYRLEAITALIRATEFPRRFVVYNQDDFSERIIRDADRSQSLDRAWIQDVILGLGREKSFTGIEMLQAQESFFRSLEFETEWAGALFQGKIPARIKEVQQLMQIMGL